MAPKIESEGKLIEFDVTGRQRTLTGEDLDRVRLGYAQHIHRAQGATVTRTLVVTGGWQTSKEPAYVEASRARQGTHWYVSRDDLGTEGHDTNRIQRLADNMGRSHTQTPSLAHPELPDPEYGRGYTRPIAPSRRSRIPGITRTINRIIHHEHRSEHDEPQVPSGPARPHRRPAGGARRRRRRTTINPRRTTSATRHSSSRQRR